MWITKDMYDRKHGQLVQRRQEINELLERHHEGDEKFRISLTTLVTLASKAADIFDCSTIDGILVFELGIRGCKATVHLKSTV